MVAVVALVRGYVEYVGWWIGKMGIYGLWWWWGMWV